MNLLQAKTFFSILNIQVLDWVEYAGSEKILNKKTTFGNLVFSARSSEYSIWIIIEISDNNVKKRILYLGFLKLSFEYSYNLKLRNLYAYGVKKLVFP